MKSWMMKDFRGSNRWKHLIINKLTAVRIIVMKDDERRPTDVPFSSLTLLFILHLVVFPGEDGGALICIELQLTCMEDIIWNIKSSDPLDTSLLVSLSSEI